MRVLAGIWEFIRVFVLWIAICVVWIVGCIVGAIDER